VFIELKKFKPTNRAERKLQDLWLRFLTEIDEDTTETPPEMLADEEIREALEYMRVAAFTKEQLLKYDQMKIDVITASGLLESAKREGREEGRAEGEAERSQLKTDLEAVQTKLKNIVINYHHAGESLEKIASFTGLTIDEIELILKK
jgi:predicted transposase/invertase (TIGR01784 family)